MVERMMTVRMDGGEPVKPLDEIPNVTSSRYFDVKLDGSDDHIWYVSSSQCSSTSPVSYNGGLSVDGSEGSSSPVISEEPWFRPQTMRAGGDQIEPGLVRKDSPSITSAGSVGCKEQSQSLSEAFRELGIREVFDEVENNKVDESDEVISRSLNHRLFCDEVGSRRLRYGDNTSADASDYYSGEMSHSLQPKFNAENGIDVSTVNYNWGGSSILGGFGFLNNVGGADRVLHTRQDEKSPYASKTLGMTMSCPQMPFSFGNPLEYGKVPVTCGFRGNSVMHTNENLHHGLPVVRVTSNNLPTMRSAQFRDVFADKREGILGNKDMQKNHRDRWFEQNGDNGTNAYTSLNYFGPSVGESFELGSSGPRPDGVPCSFSHNSASPPLFRRNFLLGIQGRISDAAKDQQGCRYLQRVLELGAAQEATMIFSEIIGHAAELMKDPFGNYLMQKMLDVCTERQRTLIICAVTAKPKELANISVNTHGTRVVQRLIETLKEPHQIWMVVSSLEPWVVNLMMDLNGNHVVQSCLRSLSIEDNKFLFDASAKHCVEIGTHQHGCCVLQHCLRHSTRGYRQSLVAEIVANALILSQDAFGNYVVQYVLSLKIQWATEDIVHQLQGNYVDLSMQKYGSNVVETCLKHGGEYAHSVIIHELVSSSSFEQLLQHQFANYVVQSALKESKGAVCSVLVEAIRPLSPVLRTNPYGKRILSRFQSKK